MRLVDSISKQQVQGSRSPKKKELTCCSVKRIAHQRGVRRCGCGYGCAVEPQGAAEAQARRALMRLALTRFASAFGPRGNVFLNRFCFLKHIIFDCDS